MLFDEDVIMKKAQKSTLIQQHENTLTQEDKNTNFEKQSFKSEVVFDVMAIFRNIKLQKLKKNVILCK